MDAQTREYLAENEDIDIAVCALVRLAREANERDGHGNTGVELICKGRDQKISYREIVHLVFKS